MMNIHTEYAKSNQFGYKLLKPLFFLVNENTNSEILNFSKLLQKQLLFLKNHMMALKNQYI